jgi:hypothetical protein
VLLKFGIGAGLAIASTVIGYQLYQERQKNIGIEISVGEHSFSIEKK